MKNTKGLFFSLFLLLTCLAGCSSGGSEIDGTYSFYGINDFHGSVKTTILSSYIEGGLARVGGFLHDKKEADPDHTVIISAGDMWQGSLESNDNHGALVTEAMNYIGFDAMTLGNHEFDYGQSYLATNQEAADFPLLAGNVRTFEGGKATDEDWGKTEASTIITRGKTKIGIIGMIGKGQTTSILSSVVKDFVFVDPAELVKKESIKLKQEGCNIVILSIHDHAETVASWDYASHLSDYLDGVFCGHYHALDNTTIDGVPLIQSYCNGSAVGHFDLTIKDGEVQCSNQEVISMSLSYSESAAINTIEDKYIGTEAFKNKANATCGTLVDSFDKTTIAQAASRAMYDRAFKDYPSIACSMINTQRAGISAGEITYSEIFKACPFANAITIMNVKGEDIINEAQLTLTYTGDITLYGVLDSSTYYDVAVIDYMAIHQDVDKVYDYFPSLNDREDAIIDTIQEYPVDLLFSFFSTYTTDINASSFSGPNYDCYNVA